MQELCHGEGVPIIEMLELKDVTVEFPSADGKRLRALEGMDLSVAREQLVSPARPSAYRQT